MKGTQASTKLSRRARSTGWLAWLSLLSGLLAGGTLWGAAAVGPEEPSAADGVEEVLVEEPVAGIEPQPAEPSNPYTAVVTRNPFGLKDPPPPKPPEPEPEPEPEVEPSALKLSAISTLLSTKHAMFVLDEKGKERVFSGLVAEGDTDSYIAGLEVLTIDPLAGSVLVNYGGKELQLDFKNNGLDPPKAAAATAARRTGSPAARVASTGRTVTSTRTTAGTRPGSTTWTSPTVNRGGTGGGAGSAALRVTPSRTLRSTPLQRSDVPVPSPAEQVLIMRAQEEAGWQQGIAMPPSPPVPGLDMPPGPGGGGSLPPDFPPLPGQ